MPLYNSTCSIRSTKIILAAGKVIYSDFVTDIQRASSNDEIFAILNIASRFSHKEPEATIQMAEATIRRDPIDPQIIGEYGGREILGKTTADLLEKCINILWHTRYWDVERILPSLFALAHLSSDDISKKAIETIKALAKYDHLYIRERKNLYPQIASLNYLQKISKRSRKKHLLEITTILAEVVSSSVEGSELTSPDQITMHTGTLTPSEGLKKLRRRAMDFVVELYEEATKVSDQLILIHALLSALAPPRGDNISDGLITMLQEDFTYLSAVLPKLLFSGDNVINYPVAREVESELKRLQKSNRFQNDAVHKLRDQLRKDEKYTMYSSLVGDIHEFGETDENWRDSKKRRSEEIDRLVARVTPATFADWYKLLNVYAQPLAKGGLDEHKYRTFQDFIACLTEAKPELATAFMTRAITEKTPLGQVTFVTPFLRTLRLDNNFDAWDTIVSLIRKKRIVALTRSIVNSFMLPPSVDLKSSIREVDLETLEQLAKAQPPYRFTKNAGPLLRFALINTLTRIFNRDQARIEAIVIAEMKGHPQCLQLYFRELPFAPGREWMSFKEWSPAGIAFLKEQLIKLPDLDWHVQEMMLELSDDPLALILSVFKTRVQTDKARGNLTINEVPFDFNQDLRTYLAGHDRYVEEMVAWLEDMSLGFSAYNWHVTHFIQRIGGPSYATILMKLIEKGDKDSLVKAVYALQALDGADLNLSFEIVRRTDDKEVLGQLEAAMWSTGVVLGEYGLAEAYETKAQELEGYLSSENERIRRFAIGLKESFEESAISQRESVTTRRKRREIEFDS